MPLGYARVSKSDDTQDTAAQVSALKSAGCKRVFEDKASGGRWDRPELHRLLDQLRAGDTLVVWKLDRLSRSLKDLLHILESTPLPFVDPFKDVGRNDPCPCGSGKKYKRSAAW